MLDLVVGSEKNSGWWDEVWNNYSDKRFKQTSRISRATFCFILSRIEHHLQRQTLTEAPISPEERLGICLYRLGRGDYYFTISEMTGRGLSTVSSIAKKFLSFLWNTFAMKVFQYSCQNQPKSLKRL